MGAWLVQHAPSEQLRDEELVILSSIEESE